MNINPINSVSYNNYYISSPSFRAKSPIRINLLKNLKDVSCIYCGEKMLTFNQVEEYSAKASKLKGKELFKYLSQLEHHMKPHEKQVLLLIKEGIKKNPECNLQEVLQNMFPRHLEKLEKQQKYVLKQIGKEAKHFNEDDRILTMFQVYKGLIEIKKRDDIKHFKLNKYLSDFYKIKDQYVDKNNFDKIDAVIHSMPNTHTNIDAFIVKYSRKNSKEIVERLLRPSQLSIEHLLPKSLGGTNEIRNIALACGKDNSTRSSKPLDTMTGLKIHSHNYFRTLRLALAKILPEHECIRAEEQYIIPTQENINSMLSEGNKIKFNKSRDCCH